MDGLRKGQDLHYAMLFEIITNSGAPDLYLTTYGEPIDFQGNRYNPAMALSPTATREEVGLRGVDLEISGGLTTDLVSEKDLRSGAYRKANVNIYVVDARYPWAGYFRKEFRDVRQNTFNGEDFTATLTGLSNRTQIQKGYTQTRTCRDFVGGRFCRKDMTDETAYNCRVIEVIDSVTFKVNFDDLQFIDDGDLERGKVFWIGGDNRGSISVTREHIGQSRRITLFTEPPSPIKVGDVCNLEKGCNGLRITCAQKFDHYDHYQGQPFLPGPKRTLNTPRSL